MGELIQRVAAWFNDRILRRVLRNSTYLILSNVISVFLTIFITRRLGVYNYGVLGLITSYVTNVNKLFSFRMNEVVVRFVGEAYVQGDRRKTGALIKFAALVETANGILRVINRYRSIALVSLVQNVIVAAIVFISTQKNLGLIGILSAYLIGKIILGIVPIILCIVWLPNLLGHDWAKAPLSLITNKKQILQFTVSTNISSTINLLARDGELLWVGALLSPIYAGYYKTAMTVINMVLTPVNPLIDTTYPEMNRAIIAKQWDRV